MRKCSIQMKNRDKYYLKALLLASISSIGMPVVQSAGASNYIARKEREGSETSTEMVSEALTSGILESHPSYGEIFGHTSHSSHSSHGSHGSHSSSTHGSHSSHTSSTHSSHTSHTSSTHSSHTSSSHTSSSGYNDGGYSGYTSGGATRSGSSAEVKGLLIGTGAVLAGVGVYMLVKHIIKKHKEHVATRKADINRYRAFGSRDLKSGMYGNDVDRMTDLLVENGALDRWDRTVSHKWSHIKYNRKVKRSVKRMQARMGRKRTGKASSEFLLSLQQWKDNRRKLMTTVARDSLDLTKDRNALLAVAILLVEKGYLKSYDADDIMSEKEKSKIVESYHEFLRENNLVETSLVDEQTLRLLMSLPNDNQLAETSFLDEQKMNIPNSLPNAKQ